MTAILMRKSYTDRNRTHGQSDPAVTSALAVGVQADEAFRHVVSGYQKETGTPTERLAFLLSSWLNRCIQPRTLWRWQEENEVRTHPVPLDAAVIITVLSGNDTILKTFASATGHACIKLPACPAAAREAIPAILRTIRECAEAVEEATRASEVRRISDIGIHKLSREIAEGIDALLIMRETFIARWTAEKARVA